MPIKLEVLQTRIAHGQLSKELILTMEVRMLNAVGSLSIVTAYDFITLLIENMRVSTSKEKDLRDRISQKAISRLHQSVLVKELIELKPSKLALRCLKNAFKDLAKELTADKENV